MICSECREECLETTVDEGIGPFEFWGAKGNDSQIVVVSDCCEARILRDPSEVLNLRLEEEAARADAMLDMPDVDLLW